MYRRVYIIDEQLKSFVSWRSDGVISKTRNTPFHYESDDTYCFTLDDMLDAPKKIALSDMDNETIFREWYAPTSQFLHDDQIILF